MKILHTDIGIYSHACDSMFSVYTCMFLHFDVGNARCANDFWKSPIWVKKRNYSFICMYVCRHFEQ